MNELPLAFFIVTVAIQVILFFYMFWNLDKDIFSKMIAAIITTIFGFTNSNMILNGNIVLVQTTGTTYSFIPIQSLPVHYLLLGMATISGLMTIFILFRIVQSYVTNLSSYSALDDNKGWRS